MELVAQSQPAPQNIRQLFIASISRPAATLGLTHSSADANRTHSHLFAVLCVTKCPGPSRAAARTCDPLQPTSTLRRDFAPEARHSPLTSHPGATIRKTLASAGMSYRQRSECNSLDDGRKTAPCSRRARRGRIGQSLAFWPPLKDAALERP